VSGFARPGPNPAPEIVEALQAIADDQKAANRRTRCVLWWTLGGVLAAVLVALVTLFAILYGWHL
jgi:hypothetical protein